jgi:hypothetical protein
MIWRRLLLSNDHLSASLQFILLPSWLLPPEPASLREPYRRRPALLVGTHRGYGPVRHSLRATTANVALYLNRDWKEPVLTEIDGDSYRSK